MLARYLIGTKTSGGIHFKKLANGSIGPIAPNMEIWQQQEKWAEENKATAALSYLLQQMQQECLQQKIIFAATAFTRGKYDKRGKLFAQICDQNNIPFLDVSKHFTEQDLTYASLMYSGQYDGHYGVKGNQVFAQAIKPILKQWLQK